MSVTPIPSRNARRLATPLRTSPVQAARSPREWLAVLEERLRKQQDEVDVYERYFVGDHPLRFATTKFKEVFGNLFGAFSDNWNELIVLASVERLEVTGFRTGVNDEGDAAIWRRWQENNLDNGSVLAHTEAVKTGRAYVIVNSDGRMAVEHPAQVVVAHMPGDRRQRLAALKKWIGSDGHAYANVYLPDQVVKYRSKSAQTDPGYTLSGQTGKDAPASDGWEPRIDDPGGRHNFGVVPVVPLYNNPGMLCDGTSDLRVSIPLTNAINKQVLDMMVASEFAAFPQRVLIGVELPKDPITQQPLASTELRAHISRLWNLEDSSARVEQLAAADLNNYVKPIEMLIQHLAAQTRTPPHYLLSSIVNASGDALKSAEAGLVSKVEKKILDFSDAWEEAVRLSFKATDDRAADATDLETIWADPEKKSEAEKVDAAQKLLALDVPHEIAWERAGLSPKEIEKAKAALPEILRQKALQTAPAGQQDPQTTDPQENP
jgi:hypothetical protein